MSYIAPRNPYAPLPKDATQLIISFLTTPWIPANLARLQYHLHPSFEWYERPRDVKPIFGPVEFKNRLEQMWREESGITDLQVKIISIAEVPDPEGKLEYRGVKVVLCERLDIMKYNVRRRVIFVSRDGRLTFALFGSFRAR